MAQNNIAVVNSQQLLATIEQKVYVDSMYSAIHDSLMQVGLRGVKKLQKKYAKYQKHIEGGCHSHEQEKKMREEIQADQNELAAFEKYILDSLPLFQQAVLHEITQLINKEITVYAKEKGLTFVVDTKELKYYDETIDISTEILPRIKARQSNHPTWIDKVETLKAHFFIEEKLKYKF